ncbi:MAG TPA: molybdate ABC transporter permease subunit [Candidatus Methylacidiphilales bacterium]|jgi:molybdate transport system permease protein|nr:molybdate ABC transporter permease subunit [Candidatus Methylacidiphilales bacterium]
MDSSSDLQLTANDAHAIVLTLASALLAVLIDLAPGVALAWLLARRQWRGKSLVETVVALPLVLPPVATGLLLLDLLGRNGPLGGWLYTWAIDVVFTWKAVAIAMAVMSFPFIVRGARIAFEAAGDRPEQVAATLGASPLRVLFSVTLPIAWRGITAGAVMAYARALGEFGAVVLVAGNIPGVTATISTTIYNDILTGHDQHALLLAAISIVLAFALILAGEQLLRRALP